jgi:hypothetical protein
VAAESTDYQQRFTKLAQNAFRMKVVVLLLLLVALFVVWSTLTNGNAKAEEVDKRFCQQIVADPYYSTNSHFGEFSCDSSLFFRRTIQEAKHMHDNDPPEPETASAQERAKHVREFLDHLRQFDDYDWNRRQAYRIELSLPYTKGAVPLNGSLISDAWPFCMLLALSVAIALGFRQTCYEIQLSALIKEEKEPKIFGRDSALSEFLAGDISEVKHGGRTVFLYKRPIGLFPEVITSGVLFVAVSILSLNLLTDYSPQFTERGYEVFGDYYYIGLYAFFVVLFLLLLRTRRLWMSSVDKAVGGEVSSGRLFFLYRGLRFLRNKSVAGFHLESALVLMCVGAGLMGLFLHWGSYRGFTLLCCIRRVVDNDVLLAARVIQSLMLMALIFLLAVAVLRWPILVRHQRLCALVLKIRTFTAWPVLVVVGFIFFYAFIGVYGALKDSYVSPALGLFSYDALLNLQSLPTLGGADFSAGFTTFSIACGILAFVELCFEQPRKSNGLVGWDFSLTPGTAGERAKHGTHQNDSRL